MAMRLISCYQFVEEKLLTRLIFYLYTVNGKFMSLLHFETATVRDNSWKLLWFDVTCETTLAAHYAERKRMRLM